MNSQHIEKLRELNERKAQGEAITPQVLSSELQEHGGPLEAKDWNDVLAYYLSDEKLARRHSELIESDAENVAIKAVELGYKVKGKLQEPPKQATIITLDFLQ